MKSVRLPRQNVIASSPDLRGSASAVFSQSKWIWPDNHHWDIHNSYALFRKAFDLPKIPAQAPLFITADQSYQLYVNGLYVNRGPARGFQSHWPYDRVDIRPFLRKGRNVIAIRAHNPGFSNFQYITQGFAGLLVSAKWGQTRIVSDKTWKARRQIGINPAALPASFQLFCQEHIDLRIEDPNWSQPDYDDDSWISPVAEHPWNGMPWYSLEERGLPLLEEKEISSSSCIGSAQGRCTQDYRTTRDVTRTRHAEGLAHHKWECPGEEITVPKTGRHRYRSYLIDFGRTEVGSLGLQIHGAKGGEIIDSLHVETIDQRTLTPHFTPDRHCRMAFGHRVACREGDQTHVFYHAFGFRYMVLTVRDSQQPLNIRISLRTACYPLEQKGEFHSSDAGLEKIWKTCAWTQKVCSLDAYVDTPWREQAQWWGDARVQAKNTFFFSGDTRLFRRGIAQIASQLTPEGLTYGHAPTLAHSCILPDFTLVWMITLWDYYWQTGSLEPFLTHQETILGALRYFEGRTDPRTGLVGYDDRYWLFLDWTGLFKEGYSTVYNLWILITLEKLTDLYRMARNPAEAQRLSDWAAHLRKALSHVVQEDGLLCDGLTYTGKRVTETSIHSQTLALIANFRPEQNATRIEKVLLPFIRGETKPAVSPSCYWITYVFEALTTTGYGAEVIDFIREKWKPMADHGTTWEVFEPRVGDESFSHAWSAHPLYHLMQTVGGIRQTAPAWKNISFQPCFIGKRGGSTIPSPYGLIRSSWMRTGSTIKVALALPEGVSATVALPGRRRQIVEGKTDWKLDA